ncbi:hypothetical protein BH10PLA2_BH10PLA2_35270 [soil metagenome]
MMRLIVSRSTKRTDSQETPGDPAGALDARRGRSAGGIDSHARRTSSIISNRPGILVLGTLLVVALSSTLILSNADVSRRPGELSLHGGTTVSKFKDVSGGGIEAHMRALAKKAEAVGSSIVQRIAQPTVPKLSTTDMMRARNRQPLPPREYELQQVGFQQLLPYHKIMDDPYDLINIPRDAHLGVGPMLKDWKSLTAFTLLAGAIMQGSVAQAFQEPLSDSEKLDNIQKQLKSQAKTLEDNSKILDITSKKLIETVNDLRDVKLEVGKGFDDVKNKVTDIALAQQTTRQSVDVLREDVGKLRTEVDSLRNRVQTQNSADRASNYLTESASTVGSGRVEMINDYNNPVAIVVNRRTYYLAPSEKRNSEPVPAGTFTYEVLGIQSQVVKSMGPNQILTVRVYNR